MTIVIAVKNDFPRLQQLLGRAMNAELGPVEVVVVDGDSSDGTRELLALQDWAGPVPVRWLSEPDNGIAEAWNRGVDLARGEWIVFLGADDTICDEVAWQHAVDVLGYLPSSCGIAAFPVAVVSQSGRVLATEQQLPGPTAARILAGERIAHQGMFHRRTLWASCGGFDTSYRIAADYEFSLRACKNGASVESFRGVPAVAMTFGGVSKQSPLATQRELQRAQRTHGVAVSLGMRWAEWGRAWLRWCASTFLPPSVVGHCADLARRLRGLPPVWTVP